MGGVLTLLGKATDQGELISVGGVLSSVSPVINVVTTKLKNSLYNLKKEQWKELLVDADTFLDNFNELTGITKSIRTNELGKINEIFNGYYSSSADVRTLIS